MARLPAEHVRAAVPAQNPAARAAAQRLRALRQHGALRAGLRPAGARVLAHGVAADDLQLAVVRVDRAVERRELGRRQHAAYHQPAGSGNNGGVSVRKGTPPHQHPDRSPLQKLAPPLRPALRFTPGGNQRRVHHLASTVPSQSREQVQRNGPHPSPAGTLPRGSAHGARAPARPPREGLAHPLTSKRYFSSSVIFPMVVLGAGAGRAGRAGPGGCVRRGSWETSRQDFLSPVRDTTGSSEHCSCVRACWTRGCGCRMGMRWRPVLRGAGAVDGVGFGRGPRAAGSLGL